MRFVISAVVSCLVIHQCLADTCSSAGRWGFICRTETSSAICVYDGTEFVQISRYECDDGLYCNEEFRNCTTTPSFTLNYAERFECPSIGFYPDLGDCGKYLYCPGYDQPVISLSCPEGYMYSTKTGCCSQQRTVASCNQRQVFCRNENEISAWAENNNYFYFCRKVVPQGFLFPQLVKCPENQIFDGMQCSARDVVTVQPNPGTGPIGGLTTPVSSGAQTCTVGSFSVDSSDCRKYWYCGSNGTWISYNCGAFSRFDIASKMCKIGNC